MATVKTLVKGYNKLVVNVTHTWATADETNVVIVDRSTLIGPDGLNIPGKIRVDEMEWSISGSLETVKLTWDLSTDEVIANLSGAGYKKFPAGMQHSGSPATATEGDILLSTTGGAANDSYDILLFCTLKL